MGPLLYITSKLSSFPRGLYWRTQLYIGAHTYNVATDTDPQVLPGFQRGDNERCRLHQEAINPTCPFRFLQKSEHLKEGTAKLWLSQLLLGLWYLRQHHVLHRDIKTANLLLTADNNLQIGDFGFATFRTGAGNEDHGIIGTPHYMAPEMLMRK